MIEDPAERGRATATLYAAVTPRLFQDLLDASLVPDPIGPDRERARREWECFALYACVRGLVAAGGFNRETASAIEALHETALVEWLEADHGGETLDHRRRLIAERYAEYGAIGQAGGKSGAGTVTARLGAAAARHMMGSDSPPAGLEEMVGTLHESLVEGVAESVRDGGAR